MADRSTRADLTSLHVRRAASGDGVATTWLVERFTPALLLMAERSMGPLALAAASPDDVVQHVWFTALRRLPDFDPEKSGHAPRLVRFLCTILARHVRDLTAKRMRSGLTAPPRRGDDGPPGVSGIADPASAALTAVMRGERRTAVRAAIESLEPLDRDIVVRRAFEEESCESIAADLGITANVVAQRHRRALAKLRAALPSTIFDDLDDEGGDAREEAPPPS